MSDEKHIYWPSWEIPTDEEGKTWKIQKKNPKIIEDIEKDCWEDIR